VPKVWHETANRLQHFRMTLGMKSTDRRMSCDLPGGLEAHNFYSGEPGAGVVYLVIFWAFIPTREGLIEGITLLTMRTEVLEAQDHAPPCELASRSLPTVGLALWNSRRRSPEHLHPWPSVCGSISQHETGAIVTYDVRLA
jgi:hypothetical protein